MISLPVKFRNMPYIWQISAIHLDRQTLVTGVLLKHTHFVHDRKISTSLHLWHLMRSYGLQPYAKKNINIVAGSEKIAATTDRNGGFAVVIDRLITREPHICTPDGTCFEKLQYYPVIFEKTGSPFDIISDIDDTILVSYTKRLLKRITTLTLKAPHKRKTVPYTQRLFEELHKQGARFFYISKSESNLFGLLTAFIYENNLPEGPLILTSYLQYPGLLRSKKGKDYKLNHIRYIIAHSPEKKFILIGDDSQKDMEVYTGIVKEFEGRILKVYIRQTRKHRSRKQEANWQTLQATGVPVLYFHSEKDFDEEIVHLHKIFEKAQKK